MSIFHKKVTKDETKTVPAFGDPFHKFKVGITMKNSIQKDYLEKLLRYKIRGYSNTKALYKNVLDINSQHEQNFVRFKLPYSSRVAFNTFTYDLNKIKKVTGIEGQIVSYEFTAGSDLGVEYLLSLQVDYNFTTKEFSKDGYTFRHKDSVFATVIQEKEEDSIYKKDSVVDITDLGLYIDFNSYILKELTPKIYEVFKKQWEIDYTNPDNKVISTPTEIFVDRSDGKIAYRAITYFTWKDHKEGDLDKLEPIYYDFYVTDIIDQLRLISKNEKAYFIESTLNGNRSIYYGRNKDSLATTTSSKLVSVAANYPLKRNVPSGNKFYNKAMEEAGYKNKTTKKKPKNDKNVTSLFTQLNNEEHVQWASITQFMDLKYFCYKFVRENKNWQKYLWKIFTFLESIARAGTYHENAPRTVYSVAGKEFRIQYIKREVEGVEHNKICYMGTEPNCSAMYLYLNVPDWTASTEEQANKKVFTKFIQYGFNISYFYSRAYTQYWSTSGGGEGRTYRHHAYINATNVAMSERRLTGISDDYNFLDTQLGFEDVGYIRKPTDDSSRQWSGPKYRYVNNIGNNPTTGYVRVPCSIQYINLAQYEKDNGRVWVNLDNTPATRGALAVYYTASYTQGDETGTYETEQIVGYINASYNPNASYAYSSSFNYMPEFVSDEKYLIPMPRSLWIRVPYSAQLEIYLATIYLTYNVEWEEKKTTAFGKIIGPVIAIVGFVIGVVFSWTGYGGAAGFSLMAAGIALTGAMNNILWLQIVGMVMSIYASWWAIPAAGGQIGMNLATVAATAATVASVVGAINVIGGARTQAKIRQAQEDFKDEKDRNNQEQERLRDTINGTLDLSEYDVDINHEEDDEIFYLLASGEFSHLALEKGLLYATDLAQDAENFNRFK